MRPSRCQRSGRLLRVIAAAGLAWWTALAGPIHLHDHEGAAEHARADAAACAHAHDHAHRHTPQTPDDRDGHGHGHSTDCAMCHQLARWGMTDCPPPIVRAAGVIEAAFVASESGPRGGVPVVRRGRAPPGC